MVFLLCVKLAGPAQCGILFLTRKSPPVPTSYSPWLTFHSRAHTRSTPEASTCLYSPGPSSPVSIDRLVHLRRAHKSMGPYNIVIFGESGSGKSSLVNLVTGSPYAKVSPDAEGCTTQCKKYTFSQDAAQYYLWDTPGLKEPRSKVKDQAPVIAECYSLVRYLADHGGANLLVYCISGMKDVQVPSVPPSTLQSHYRLFHEIFFRGVPLIIVVTHLDSKERREEWWKTNEEKLKHVEISISGHVCVTACETSDKESATDVRRMLLEKCSRKSRWRPSLVLEGLRLSKEAVKSLPSVSPRWDMTISGHIMAGMLTARCGLEGEEVMDLVKRMRAPSRNGTPPPTVDVDQPE